MGKYINIGNDGFRKAREGEYVDIERITTNVPHDVAHGNKNVAHERQEQIRQLVRHNPTVTRKKIAEKLSVSVKTIARALEQMPDVRYVGSSDKGHWEVG